MADEINSLQTPPAPQEQIPAQQPEISQQQAGQQPVGDGSQANSEVDTLRKRLHDTQEWANKVAQEKAELARRQTELENAIIGKKQEETDLDPAERAELEKLFYPEQIAAITKLTKKMSEKQATDLIRKQVGPFLAKQYENDIETAMVGAYADYKQVEPEMLKTLQLMPEMERARYIGTDKDPYLVRTTLYEKTKRRLAAQSDGVSSTVHVSGRPAVPVGRSSIPNETLELANQFGLSKEQLEKSMQKGNFFKGGQQ